MKLLFITTLILASFSVISILVKNIKFRLKLRGYAQCLDPIFEFSELSDDQNVLKRCSGHLILLIESGNKIYQKLQKEQPKVKIEVAPGQYKEIWLDFINPIIYKEGYPNETWEEYLQRREWLKKLITEAFHQWLRSIGEKVQNNEWYVEKVLKQNGANTVKNYMTFQK